MMLNEVRIEKKLPAKSKRHRIEYPKKYLKKRKTSASKGQATYTDLPTFAHTLKYPSTQQAKLEVQKSTLKQASVKKNSQILHANANKKANFIARVSFQRFLHLGLCFPTFGDQNECDIHPLG